MQTQKKLFIFGAGKIGRSFIGQLFSRSGYEVVFADTNVQLINELNRRKSYRVIFKSDSSEEIIEIGNVRGILFSETDEVVTELSTASVAAFSVGRQALPQLLPIVANALLERKNKLYNYPLDFIIAENMRHADQFIAGELKKLLPDEYPFEKLVGLVETSIGKMVPIMGQKYLDDDPLQVFAEPYNTLIVAGNSFKNPIPEVSGLAPKENIKAWVDRKLFIHNLGHAAVAYLGYQKYPGAVYLHEVLEDQLLLNQVRETMLQSAQILIALYPNEFTMLNLEEHTEDLLYRFRNKALGDTIFRVGCDLQRKLAPEDRILAPIIAAIKTRQPYNLIYSVLEASFNFRATDENGQLLPADLIFINNINYEKEKILGFLRIL